MNTDDLVVHCKRDRHDFYVGRPGFFGNPFVIGKDGTREEVLQKYEDYLESNPYLLNRLPELKGKILGCWCKPIDGFDGGLLCHAQILARRAND